MPMIVRDANDAAETAVPRVGVEDSQLWRTIRHCHGIAVHLPLTGQVIGRRDIIRLATFSNETAANL